MDQPYPMFVILRVDIGFLVSVLSVGADRPDDRSLIPHDGFDRRFDVFLDPRAGCLRRRALLLLRREPDVGDGTVLCGLESDVAHESRLTLEEGRQSHRDLGADGVQHPRLELPDRDASEGGRRGRRFR